MGTIAVVDDDEDMRMLMVMRLRMSGYEVRHSGNGLAGLELIRALRPDLVVLDWLMPGKSGIDVCRELRRDPELTGTPVVMVTSRSTVADLALALAAGVTFVVTKPFSLKAFPKVIRGLLEPD